MGSLGQYKGEVSNVHDVHIENVWMMNGDVCHIPGSLVIHSNILSIPVLVSKSGPEMKLARALLTT
jgi:hypothetical protein